MSAAAVREAIVMLRSLKQVAVLLLVAPAFASAETIARFAFLSDFSASDVNPDLIVSGFVSGTAITDVALESDGLPPNSWYGENWTLSNDPAVAVNSDSYASFQVTPEPGMVMTLSGLAFAVRPHGSGPSDFLVTVVNVSSGLETQMDEVLFHPDQSIFDLGRKAWATLLVISDGGFQNIVGTHEIRIYGFDAARVDREVLFDNVTVEGTVSLIPEPTAFGSLALAGLLTCGLGRRRQSTE
jgi:hypothetical protein